MTKGDMLNSISPFAVAARFSRPASYPPAWRHLRRCASHGAVGGKVLAGEASAVKQANRSKKRIAPTAMLRGRNRTYMVLPYAWRRDSDQSSSMRSSLGTMRLRRNAVRNESTMGDLPMMFCSASGKNWSDFETVLTPTPSANAMPTIILLR